MANTIMGMNNYYNAFISPLSSNQVNPVTNFMYGFSASKVYSQTVAKKLQSNMSSYLTSLSSNVSDMKSAAKPLVAKGSDSSFNQKSVTSLDSSAVSGTAASNADLKTYTVNVKKLATSQVNNGTSLVSNDKSTLSSGLNTLKLQVGKSEKNISFTIDEKDTNKSGLEKMAKSINSAKAGVTANVVTDTKAGTSYLKITGDKTGTDNTFSLSDVSGNAVSVSGSNSIASQAQNAEYTLDDKQYTSQDNTISVDNAKVQLTLNKAEGKDVKVTVGTDTKAIKSDVQDLVDSYNAMVSFASSNSANYSGAQKLNTELADVIRSRGASLQSIGISKNEDGTLSVDSKKLENALSQDASRVKDVFGGYNGIAEKLYSKANEVLNSPMKYSSPQEFSDNGYGSFYNFASQQNSSMNSRNMYSGLVVDMLL